MSMEDKNSAELPVPQALYNDTALRWVRREPTSLSDFTARPPTLAMCEPVAGQRVLDLGCGEGYCSRLLRRAGARRVLGIDISSRMIGAAQAEESRDPLGIEYIEGDATELEHLPSASFDVVLAMFLFNYMTLDETRRCMAHIARILVPGGKFVLAAPHPMLPFMRPKEPPFYFDLGDARYFEAHDRRFPGRIWRRDGVCLDVQLCHKTFEDYFDALRLAGFKAMPTMRELRVTAELLTSAPEFFGPLKETPLHIAISVTQ